MTESEEAPKQSKQVEESTPVDALVTLHFVERDEDGEWGDDLLEMEGHSIPVPDVGDTVSLTDAPVAIKNSEGDPVSLEEASESPEGLDFDFDPEEFGTFEVLERQFSYTTVRFPNDEMQGPLVNIRLKIEDTDN